MGIGSEPNENYRIRLKIRPKRAHRVWKRRRAVSLDSVLFVHRSRRNWPPCAVYEADPTAESSRLPERRRYPCRLFLFLNFLGIFS
ncbi:hypothetical protein J5N97_025710 [Dioscorea zingiberensis]|uniref:Uncharacterized protein n=1 Tax=Dioscorea zingiberensis TaxID=325984 RepID=A0A9D5C1V8_9LILI|nr:hypothetical protein J5N97_025710 [Dioscorea zingiberensis]